MNSDEYHTFTLDNDHNNICRFCGETFGDHEQTCPHNPEAEAVDRWLYDRLKEPWIEAP